MVLFPFIAPVKPIHATQSDMASMTESAIFFEIPFRKRSPIRLPKITVPVFTSAPSNEKFILFSL